MKKNILHLLMSLLFFMVADAQAQECCDQDFCFYEDICCFSGTNFYAKVLGGANFIENSTTDGNNARYQTGYVVAGSLGYRWHYGLSLEAEYAFRSNDIRKIHFFQQGTSNNGHFRTSSYMANLYWDLPLFSWKCAFWNIQPFVGAGVGYNFQQMHSSNSRIIFNQKWKRFAWQLMGGLAYPIFRDTELTLEYKFHQGDSHFYNHSIGIGLIYNFGYLR